MITLIRSVCGQGIGSALLTGLAIGGFLALFLAVAAGVL